MHERRVLVLGGGSTFTAAIVAALAGSALAGSARVVVVEYDPVDLLAEAPSPLELTDDVFVRQFRDVSRGATGYGPPKRGKKGKVVRW